eukprot:TRINITY_DN1823_c1_g2_i1.p1 TRINITY_DN1823_c1_g2~~TRINITY_DN1823_c1_g2_i1.p1  ORF type:complete len:351 (+),score=64.94 TRINITY_DN1823_c1_g2_i1:63-1115(+)
MEYRLYPHRRYNPLIREWILVSPKRTDRPWKGQTEDRPVAVGLPEHDPKCPLCPRNTRSSGGSNPDYKTCYVFTNDFSALKDDSPLETVEEHELLRSAGERGTCRVICFSPRHNVTLSQMSVGEIKNVVKIWIEQLEELGKVWSWVQLFENKGAMMGCSQPHPHGQVWASHLLPTEAEKEDASQLEYFESHGMSGNLLYDYIQVEREKEERIVLDNGDWVVMVPYWAVWPFETLLAPSRKGVRRLTDLTESECTSLAEILKDILVIYDKVFDVSFPYSFGWHGAPTGDLDLAHDGQYWHLHAHFYPPLLRSATARKFMVGYEMLGSPQRDILPEEAASRLRTLHGVPADL